MATSCNITNLPLFSAAIPSQLPQLPSQLLASVLHEDVNLLLFFSTVALILTGTRTTLKVGQRVRGLVTRVRPV